MFLQLTIHILSNDLSFFLNISSPFRKAFVKSKDITSKYQKFLLELQQKYKNNKHYPICKDIQKKYYFEIFNSVVC